MCAHACLCVSVCVCVCVCMCVWDACVLNQLLFWLRIKTADRKCGAKGQIIGPY